MQKSHLNDSYNHLETFLTCINVDIKTTVLSGHYFKNTCIHTCICQGPNQNPAKF